MKTDKLAAGSPDVVVVDYEMGNSGSMLNMLKKAGAKRAVLTRDPEVILSAKGIVLPGVGSYDTGMSNLESLGLREVLDRSVVEMGKPLLGVCLGMQLLLEGSAEGKSTGLGYVKGYCEKLSFEDMPRELRPKVPHMGWNTLKIRRPVELLSSVTSDSRYYFVHSFHAICRFEEDVVAVTNYGRDIVAAIGRGSVLGTQFHPEKSHRFGVALMRTFVSRI